MKIGDPFVLKMLSASLVLVIADSAAAADFTARACNNCTYAQVESKARSRGLGQHYFYDLTKNRFYTYYCEPGGASAPLCYETGTSAAVLAAFGNYRGAYVGNGASEKFKATHNVNVPSGFFPGVDGQPINNGYINAWSTVTISSYNRTVVEYLNNPANYSGVLGLVMQVIAPYSIPAINFENMSAVVDVVFNDGSRRTYKYDKDLQTYQAVPGTGVDSHGNTLPDQSSPPPMNGAVYTFGGVPEWNSYDYRNIHYYFNPGEPALVGGCGAIRTTDHSVTCIAPY